MCSYLVGLEVQFCFNLSSTHFGYARTRLHLCAGFISLLISNIISCADLFNSLPLGNFSCFFVVCLVFVKSIFSKNSSGISSECQTDWIQIRPNILSGLIWVQSVCKGYEQTTHVGKELMLFWGKTGPKGQMYTKSQNHT